MMHFTISARTVHIEHKTDIILIITDADVPTPNELQSVLILTLAAMNKLPEACPAV